MQLVTFLPRNTLPGKRFFANQTKYQFWADQIMKNYTFGESDGVSKNVQSTRSLVLIPSNICVFCQSNNFFLFDNSITKYTAA